MQSIVLLLMLVTGLVSDTVGIEEKSWVDVPAQMKDAESLAIGEELVIPSTSMPSSDEIIIKSAQESATVLPTIKFESAKQYQKIASDFVMPLWNFVKEHTAVFVSFLALLWSLFYFMFYRPLAKKVRVYLDEEIDLPQAILEKNATKDTLTQEDSILTQSQYATLYGLLNESYIYEKEHVLLDKHIPTDQQNREVIALEWKFNQILHFSLPKLSSNKPKVFKEGIKELLDEDVSKDIVLIALKDIVGEGVLSTENRQWVHNKIEHYDEKEISSKPTPKGLNPEVVSYSNYLAK